LSYQLCERAFDCEHCPLDAALRMHFARGAETGAGGTPPAPETGPLPDDRRYSRGHCWVMPRGAAGAAPASGEATRGASRVGIEPGLAKALLAPREVVRPTSGERLASRQLHLWIVTAGGTLPVAAPLGGTVRRVNPELAARPHLLLSSPLEEGWLYEVEPDAPEASDGLFAAAEAARLYAGDAERFRAALARELRRSGGLPVLADGGVMLDHVADMLGPPRYFALLARAFGRG
ncbi:MAG TPA: hypothetical protein VIW03_07050, partial [Anaeromyxobacter sp.]